MVKFAVTFKNDKPALVMDFNTASTELAELVFKQFIEKASDPDYQMVLESTDNANGTTTATITIEPANP
jgi:hypothetical protein